MWLIHMRHDSFIWAMTHSCVTTQFFKHVTCLFLFRGHERFDKFDFSTTRLNEPCHAYDKSCPYMSKKNIHTDRMTSFFFSDLDFSTTQSSRCGDFQVCLACMSHVAHMNESCRTYEWVMSHIWMSHVAHMNESRRTYDSCRTYLLMMSGKWMSHVTHTHELAMSHISMSHVTHMNESYQTCEYVTSRAWMSHVARLNKSCRTDYFAMMTPYVNGPTSHVSLFIDIWDPRFLNTYKWLICWCHDSVNVQSHVPRVVSRMSNTDVRCEVTQWVTTPTIGLCCPTYEDVFASHINGSRRTHAWNAFVSSEKLSLLQSVAICCSLLQSVAVCCSLLQSVAVCCSLLQFMLQWKL